MKKYQNAEGYNDPTASEAMSMIMRKDQGSAKVNRRKKKVIYLCSRFDNAEANLVRARRFCRFAITKGCVPVAAHLFYLQFLNDGDPVQRKLGISCGKALMDRCDEIWFFGTHYSSGMREEYVYARKKGYRIRYFTLDCRELGETGDRNGAN